MYCIIDLFIMIEHQHSLIYKFVSNKNFKPNDSYLILLILLSIIFEAYFDYSWFRLKIYIH